MTYDPNKHLIKIKSWNDGKEVVSDYLNVQQRVVWFRAEFPEGSIETDVVMIDLDRVVEAERTAWNPEKQRKEKITKSAKGYACFRATVKTGKGGIATATGSESAVDFSEFLEKAETKAIGRALAGLGYGTQFAPEFNEGQRVVDAPVDQQASSNRTATSQQNPQQQQQSQIAPPKSQTRQEAPIDEAALPISERQLESIRKLNGILGKTEQDGLTTKKNGDAKILLQQLTAEYRQQHTRMSSQPDAQQQAAPVKQVSVAVQKTPVVEAPGWTLLSQEDKDRFSWTKNVLRSGFTQVCKDAQLPIESKGWTVAQYGLYAQQLDRTLTGEPLLADLIANYHVYHASAPESLRSLLSRLLMTNSEGKVRKFSDLTYKKTLELYGIFALAMPLQDFAKIYDTNFVTFKEQYGVDHLLDLYYLKDGKHNMEALQDYSKLLQQCYIKEMKKLPATLKEKHKELIATWELALIPA